MTKQKIFQTLLALLLLLFSFYYTNKSIELIKNIDPLMKQIKATTSKYETKPKNAQVIGNKIIPGINGKTIDYQKSYSKMKQYGSYNEALTTLKEVSPTISINDYYDKYIISGTPNTKNIALIFKIKKDTNPSTIISLLNEKKVTATFFIDGLYIEKNTSYLSSLTPFEIELLSYNDSYNKTYFESAKNYLESLLKRPLKYCYADYDSKEIIELCSKLKLHTILPTIKIEKSLYSEVKEKLTDSAIISLPTPPNIQELSLVIDYIKSRGYTFLTLDSLINESLEK